MFFEKMNANPNKEKTLQFKDNFENKPLFKHILYGGIGFHHSGLQIIERQTVEDFFKSGLIKVIFCTSTLAAGVNLPAKRVIIAGLRQGISNLTSIMYKQMVGRAGRYGFDTEADSYIVIPKNRAYVDRKEVLALLKKENLEYIKSSFSNEKQGLARIILDSIGTKLVRDADNLKQYLEGTLMFKQEYEKETQLTTDKS